MRDRAGTPAPRLHQLDGHGVGSEAGQRGERVVVDAAGQRAIDVGLDHRGERAQLLLDGGDLLDQGVEDAVLGPVAVREVVAAHHRLALQRAIDAAVALLHARRVPRDVEVEQIGAVALEVQALARGVGRDQDAHRVFVERAVERALDQGALIIGHAAVKLHDARVALVRVVAEVERGGELIDEVGLGVAVLGEDDHAAIEFHVSADFGRTRPAGWRGSTRPAR